MAQTKITGGLISTTSNYEVGVITATKFVGPFEGTTATFTGDVDIKGTLSYIDVDNINSTGIITAQDYVNIGAGLSVAGVSTFTSSVGIADSIIHLGNTDTSIRFPTDDTFTVETAGSEAFRIASDGEVGVGTVNPNAPLDVFSNTAATDKDLFMVRSATGAFAVQCSNVSAANPEWRLRTYSSEDMVFSPGGTGSSGEKLRITSAGRVGIGSTIPTAPLNVQAETTTGDCIRLNQEGTNKKASIYFQDATTTGNDSWITNENYDLTVYAGYGGKLNLGAYQTTGITVLSTGLVGIGTDNPTKTLMIYGTDSSSLRISKAGVLAYDHTFNGSSYTIANNNGSAGIPIAIGTKTSGGESLRIDASGNIGIGVTNPATKTHIHGGDETLLISGDTAATSAKDTGGTIALGGIYHTDGSITGWSQIKGLKDNNTSNNYNGYLSFTTRDTTDGYVERLRITSAGKVGIGTDAPADDPLTLYDADNNVGMYFQCPASGNANNNGFRIGRNDSHCFIWNYQDAEIALATAGVERLTINHSGGPGITVKGEIAAALDYPNFRPTVDWNFAAVKKLDPRITYSRTGTASYTDEKGIVRVVGDNVPRFDHDSETGESKGLLIEPSRTSKLTQSTHNDSYSHYKQTDRGETIKGPDGLENSAREYTVNSDGGTGGSTTLWANEALGMASGLSVSYFVKITRGSTIAFQIMDNNNARESEKVAISGGYITDGSYATVSQSDPGSTEGTTSYELYPNGWVRVKWYGASGSANATTYLQLYSYDHADSNGTNIGYAIWGFQVESGSHCTSVIPKPTTGTVTRGTDFAYLDGTAGTEFDDIYRTDEGTFVLDWFNDPQGNHNDGYVFTIDDGTGNNRIGAVNSNSYQLTVTEDNDSQGNRDLGSINSGDNKMAFTYKYNDQATSLNGSDASVDTSCTIPTSVLKYWWIGLRQGQYDMLGGYVKRIVYYPTRLPNSQLKTLSA